MEVKQERIRHDHGRKRWCILRMVPRTKGCGQHLKAGKGKKKKKMNSHLEPPRTQLCGLLTSRMAR